MRGIAGPLAASMAALTLVALMAVAPAAAEPRHGMALYGEPKYGADFKHFDYVNPNAPKGGKVTLQAIGSFDTLNPFALKGVPAAGATMIYDTLMANAADEPFTEYGQLAESIEVPEDRSWVAFTLRPQARWHDGKPVTAEDVVFTFHTLTESHPFYRSYYAAVDKVEADGDRRVRFTFKPGDNRELPLIVGQLPVLPKHYWEGKEFQATTLDPPLGSGPYRIAAFDPGRSISYERVADYWGADLAVNVGRNNFGTMAYEYFRDASVALQAFRGGLYDFRQENVAKTWATGYDFDAVQAGKVVREEIPNQVPAGMQGYVFNTRRPMFADRRVRWAIAQAFDFEWTNQTLFYGAYKRTESYFENSPLQSQGVPQGRELALLEPWRGKIPDEVFEKPYRAPSTDGQNGLRRNLLEAKRLLDEAGTDVRNGRRVMVATGQPLSFEILLDSPTFERVTLPFVENLKRLGIQANVRTVDTTQYENRIRDFDFDMTVHVWGQSLSPGNEQAGFWGSSAAERPGSQNLAGIRDPAVDALIGKVVSAGSEEDLKAAVSALDRVLLWGHYVVPQWYSGVYRVAYWNRLKRPATLPPYSLAFDAWWLGDAKSVAEQPPR
ncbi:extracellular solute-binding protein [Azospirillum rugosum]|uniref:Microcin C transport system substrate-binding protein n=1 Tax=Azospirillum rugosum TaxID=416170 RepID=A0ABS4SD84_9PROT|nr:extracellular solute-binding protein [Azospirillum rugosum]MBP2290529.1 microcin C transport system substrate-binding protein [Azospirillum rugosum]MDQ0525417.1 microcin C transport system substrate-binding protein [Azospirillum rugosum]